jgi:hypothetical protein
MLTGMGARGLLAGTGTALSGLSPSGPISDSAQHALIGGGLGAGTGALLGGLEYHMQPDYHRNDPNALSLSETVAMNALMGGAAGTAMGSEF